MMRSVNRLSRWRTGLGVALAVAVAALAPSAWAQAETANFPAERLRPATQKEGLTDVEAASVGEHLDFDIGLLAGYAHNPLVLVRNNEIVGKLVEHRLHGSLVGGISLFDWVRIGVELPVVFFQTRDTASLVDQVAGATDLSGIGLGDLRLSPKVRILRQEGQFIDLAIIPGVTLPTAAPQSSYFGEQQFTFVPELAIGRQVGPVKLLANGGVRLRFEERDFIDLTVGNELFFRAGAGLMLHDLVKLPLEIDLTFNGGTYLLEPFVKANRNPLEALLSARYDITDAFQVSAYGGLGLIPGFGVPDVRAGLALWFAPRSRDKDADGLMDKDDRCPDVAEDKDGFEDTDGCADPDNDNDTVLDVNDGAPNDPEDPDQFQDEDGVPDPDNDGDGVLDAADKCINQKGVAEYDGCGVPDTDGDGVLDPDDKCVKVPGPAASKGCPDKDGDGVLDSDDACPAEAGAVAYKGCPDSDRDGIANNLDKCPDQAEVYNGVDDADGCPEKQASKVVVSCEKIDIKEKVFYDTSKATIQKRSFALLDEMAATIKATPALAKIRIEGHTDDRGSDTANQKLSDDRAKSVREYLISKGVEAGRLEAIGFGEAKPISENKTSAGREKNRRVEFFVVENTACAK